MIALANAGGDTINAVKQAAEIGISPRSQTLVPLLVFISDVDSLGLDVAKGMTFVDGFYWDADNQTREWSKRFYARRRAHADDGACRRLLRRSHYLRAVRFPAPTTQRQLQRLCASFVSTISSPKAARYGRMEDWSTTCTSLK